MKLFIALLLLSNFALAAAQRNPCDTMKIKASESEIIAQNIANVSTTRTPAGGPYQRKYLKCNVNDICEVKSEKKVIRSFEPNHPDADSSGYVVYPDINVNKELKVLKRLKKEYAAAKNTCRL